MIKPSHEEKVCESLLSTKQCTSAPEHPVTKNSRQLDRSTILLPLAPVLRLQLGAVRS